MFQKPFLDVSVLEKVVSHIMSCQISYARFQPGTVDSLVITDGQIDLPLYYNR